MWILHQMISLEYRGAYRYYIQFEDGLCGELDFEDYVNSGPVFAPLREHSFFASAVIDGGTIAWPNGADIAPETVYA